MKVTLLNRLQEHDTLDVRTLVRRLRDIFQALELAFNKIRIDDAIIIGGGTKIAKHLSGTATWNPPDVLDAAQTTTTVTVTGAALGDTVAVGFSLDLQGMQLTGYVSSANTVTCVLRNGTGGALNLGSGTLRTDCWQH